MPSNFFIAGIEISYYSLLLVIGTAAGTLLAFRRAVKRGLPGEFLLDALPWVILGGVIGARLVHILSPPDSMVNRGLTPLYYLTHFYDAFAIWKGGFNSFGAVVGGGLALLFFSRSRGEKFPRWADTVVPGVSLGQAISSWGFYFNQELYGKPTRLPWAIEIDPIHRLEGYQQIGLYHPLFLYASLWNLFTMALLLGVEYRWKESLPRGILFSLYGFLFGLGQFGLEFLKLDSARILNFNSTILFSGLFIILSGWGFFRRLMVHQSRG